MQDSAPSEASLRKDEVEPEGSESLKGKEADEGRVADELLQKVESICYFFCFLACADGLIFVFL